MTIATETIPYIYAGAVRSGVSEAVILMRDQLLKRIPGDIAAQANAFLRTNAGESLLRLALAGALATIPADKRPAVLEDIRQELLISSASGVFVTIREFAVKAVELVTAGDIVEESET